MIWVNFDYEVDYGIFDPGIVDSMGTFTRHRWRLRRVSDGALLIDFTLDGRGDYVATVR